MATRKQKNKKTIPAARILGVTRLRVTNLTITTKVVTPDSGSGVTHLCVTNITPKGVISNGKKPDGLKPRNPSGFSSAAPNPNLAVTHLCVTVFLTFVLYYAILLT